MKDVDRLLEEKYSGNRTPSFDEDCKRLSAGEPLAYVIGNIPFLDTVIWLDSRPLIPRPETEWWTELLIQNLQDTHRPHRCLDLFSGSGCVGIALLKHVPEVSVDFGELDPSHIETIKTNIIQNDISPARARIFETDVFSNIPGKYDRITANPPYVPDDRVLEPSLSYEPRVALFGGKTGTDLIVRFITDLPQHLESDGLAYLEFDPGEEEVIRETCIAAGLSVSFHRDQFGLPRLAVLQWKA